MTTHSSLSILYVGAIDEQFTRLCELIQDWNGSITYARDCKQATKLLSIQNFTLVAIHSGEFNHSNISYLLSFIRNCQTHRLNLVKLQDSSVAVILNPDIGHSNNIFNSVSKNLDMVGEKKDVTRVS